MNIEDLRLRIFVTVPRSGSTLFMRVMAGHEELAVTSRNILMGHMQSRSPLVASRDFAPDYSIFTNPQHRIFKAAHDLGKRLVISKEELGNDRRTGTVELNECNFPMFPDDEAIRRTKPVFTFRRPYEVFDSWLSKGWTDIESFIDTYKTHVATFEKAAAINPDTVAYTYEYLTRDPANAVKVFRSICNYWGIKFKEDALEFKSEFGSDFVYRNEREREIYVSQNPKGLFTTLMNSKGIQRDVASPGLLLPEHRDLIDKELITAYNRVSQQSLRNFEPFGRRPSQLMPEPDF